MYAVIYKETKLPVEDARSQFSRSYVSHIENYTDALDVVEEFYQEYSEELFHAWIIEHE